MKDETARALRLVVLHNIIIQQTDKDPPLSIRDLLELLA